MYVYIHTRLSLWNVNSFARHMQDWDKLDVLIGSDIFVATETRMKDKEVFLDKFRCVHSPHTTLLKNI